MNWYAYTHNDPINGSDPTGTQDDNNTGAAEQIVVTANNNSPPSDPGALASFDTLLSGTIEQIVVTAQRYKNPLSALVGWFFGPAEAAVKGAANQAVKDLKKLSCGSPAIGGGGGVDAYAGGGGSLSGAGSFNPRNGQLSAGFGFGIGVGVGGGAYGQIKPGSVGGIGKGGEALPIFTAGLVVNASGELGVGLGGSYQILGSSPGDWGLTAARGGPDATANINIGVTVNLNLPALYKLQCSGG